MIRRVLSLSLTAIWAASAAWAMCGDPEPAEIYPTATELPENLLRIYIYFPRPMATTEGMQHVRLVDAAGDLVDQAFLSNREDLWSPDRRRLTLLLDPGRVKTGLDAHEELGRALVPGQVFAFEVSGDALDAEGCALGVNTRHAFTVTAADTEPPDPSQWVLSLPRAGSMQPIVVELNSAHDHLSLAYRLRVRDADGQIVPGAVALGAAEASWAFTPNAAWAAAPYTLTIDETLEDLAGNRPGLLFDRPLDQAPLVWQDRLTFTPAQ